MDPYALAGLIVSVASLVLVSRITVSRASTDDLEDCRRRLNQAEATIKELQNENKVYLANEARYQRQINNLMREVLGLPTEDEL